MSFRQSKISFEKVHKLMGLAKILDGTGQGRVKAIYFKG